MQLEHDFDDAGQFQLGCPLSKFVRHEHSYFRKAVLSREGTVEDLGFREFIVKYFGVEPKVADFQDALRQSIEQRIKDGNHEWEPLITLCRKHYNFKQEYTLPPSQESQATKEGIDLSGYTRAVVDDPIEPPTYDEILKLKKRIQARREAFLLSLLTNPSEFRINRIIEKDPYAIEIEECRFQPQTGDIEVV